VRCEFAGSMLFFFPKFFFLFFARSNHNARDQQKRSSLLLDAFKRKNHHDGQNHVQKTVSVFHIIFFVVDEIIARSRVSFARCVRIEWEASFASSRERDIFFFRARCGVFLLR